MRDGERKVELARKRSQYFRGAEHTLSLASALAHEYNCPIFHTGDLSDFVSVANLERVKQFINENDLTLSAGNHEFSQYVGEAVEDAAYREQSLAKVQAVYKNDIRASAREINGVNFIILDDGYYKIDAGQVAFLRQELERGLPSVIVMHTPIYEPALYAIERRKHDCGYLLGVPDELVDGYGSERARQQRADAITGEAIDLIKSTPSVKAIIAGHLHRDYENMLTEGIIQLTTDCETVRVIELV
jgi:3',5'-cyclic AMP phosphodiesterase CpdA